MAVSPHKSNLETRDWGNRINKPELNLKPEPVRIWHIFMDMMTSSNVNIFRVTGPLCGEFTGHWLNSLTLKILQSCIDMCVTASVRHRWRKGKKMNNVRHVDIVSIETYCACNRNSMCYVPVDATIWTTKVTLYRYSVNWLKLIWRSGTLKLTYVCHIVK